MNVALALRADLGFETRLASPLPGAREAPRQRFEVGAAQSLAAHEPAGVPSIGDCPAPAPH